MPFDISCYSSEYSESDTRIVRNIRWYVRRTWEGARERKRVEKRKDESIFDFGRWHSI